MRILFLADGRSPIAINWIQHFTPDHEVHLVSSFPCEPLPGLASFQVLPLAFSQTKKHLVGEKTEKGGWLQRTTTPQIRTALRQWVGPLTLPRAGRRFSEIARTSKADLVHAMRIPFEGMAAGLARIAPLLISVWGNDFTLHARSSPIMGLLTQRAMQRASALHTDCQRDLRLARQWGFASNKPSVVLPGGGGVQTDIFKPASSLQSDQGSPPTVINPRGFRAYVRNDTFFRAIPLVLQKEPATRFVCPAMKGEREAERWLSELQIGHAVVLLPKISRIEMAERFQRAQVAVSPSAHDGTPNTLLEAMACGCFPIAGDLESVREWINPGENGLLIDPANPQQLADAIIQALGTDEMRDRARRINLNLIAERAEHGQVMQQAEAFYQEILRRTV